MSNTNINDGIITIQVADDAIRDDDIETLEETLGVMPLERITSDEADSLLIRLLTIASEYDRKEAVPIILKAWENVYPPVENVTFFPTLFLNVGMSINLLQFITTALPEFGYLDVMDELIDYTEGPMMEIACATVISVYGEQPKINYEILRDSASERGNDVIYNFMVQKLEEVADFAPIPEWVKNFTDGPVPKSSEVIPPEMIQPSFELPSLEDMVTLLTNGLEGLGVSFEDIENTQEVLRARLSVATTTEKVALMSPIMQIESLNNLQNNVELFRILGPANPFVDADLSQMRYGGSRMFIATEFDYDEETGYVVDWFGNGVCKQCHLRMRVRWHALRLPRPTGGWLERYCSFECLRDALSDIEVAQSRPDLATRTMIDSLEEQFESIGIQDRVD